MARGCLRLSGCQTPTKPLKLQAEVRLEVEVGGFRVVWAFDNELSTSVQLLLRDNRLHSCFRAFSFAFWVPNSLNPARLKTTDSQPGR